MRNVFEHAGGHKPYFQLFPCCWALWARLFHAHCAFDTDTALGIMVLKSQGEAEMENSPILALLLYSTVTEPLCSVGTR